MLPVLVTTDKSDSPHLLLFERVSCLTGELKSEDLR